MGLADLLATAAMADWSMQTKFRLPSRWIAGCRDARYATYRSTQHRSTRRCCNGELVTLAEPVLNRLWEFSSHSERRTAVELPLSEIITISRHLSSPEIHSYMESRNH